MKIYAFLGVLLFSSLLFSCRGTKETILSDFTENTQTITVVERDTVFTTAPDSSSYNARLTVSDKGLISLNQGTTRKGKYTSIPRVEIKDNVLHVDCYSEAQRLFYKWKETYIRQASQTVRTLAAPPQIIDKPLTVWQHVQLWLGRLLLVILAAGAIALFVHHRLTKSRDNG